MSRPAQSQFFISIVFCFVFIGKKEEKSFREKKRIIFEPKKRSDFLSRKNCEGEPPSTDAFACGLCSCRARLSLSGRGILMVFTKRTQGAFGAMSRKLRFTQTRRPYKALGAAASRCDPSARNFSKSMLSARLARLAQQSFLIILMFS